MSRDSSSKGNNGALETTQSHPFVLNLGDRLRTQANPSDEAADRIAIFIDGGNLFYAAFQMQIEVDYIKLLQCLIRRRSLLRAYFYTGVDPNNEKQHGFLLWMSRNGYRVVTKDLIQFPDGSKKANLEVEMAIDMMRLAPFCKTIVLLSGDGDLAYAINSIAYKGTQIELVSLRSMVSDALLSLADYYVDLESIKQSIQKVKQPD